MSGWPVHNPRPQSPPRLPNLVAQPAWLPGDIEVQVVGEYYRREAVQAAAQDVGLDGFRVGVLVPEPSFAEHPNAIAVYVQTHLVGYLASDVAHQVRPALLAFAAANGGRLPSCPAEIEDQTSGLQVVLLLDPTPLGLPSELFVQIPEMAQALGRLLGRLDQPVPFLTGEHARARTALQAAERSCAELTEMRNDERPRDAWPRLERTVKDTTDMLAKAADPYVSRGWLTLARTTRFQKGRRDDALQAYVEALYCNRNNADAWTELFEYVTVAPYIPMLTALIARMPLLTRPPVIRHLLSVSYGQDRHGNLNARGGTQLRSALMNLATSQHDHGTVAVLAADAGLRAEKNGDLDAAVAAWRQAVAAGSTDPKVADRLSIWLIKQGAHAEAAVALSQALQSPPESASLRERLQKRLERCQRNMS